MPIKILKKSAGAVPPLAPTPVPAAPPAAPPKPAGLRIPLRRAAPPAVKPKPGEHLPEPWTPERSKEFWKNFPGPNEKRTTCEYCGQVYIRPCKKDETAELCANFVFAQEHGKRAPSREEG